LPKALIKQAKLLTIGFFPAWKMGVNAIVANFTTIISAQQVTGNAKLLQTDLAVLTISILQAVRLNAQKIKTLIIVPISINSLKQKYFYDVYLNLLKKINPGLTEYFIFEIRDTPNPLTESMRFQIAELNEHARAIMININILASPKNVKLEGNITPHAYGLDLRGATSNMPEEQIAKRIQKFSAFYKTSKTPTFIKGIPTTDLGHKSSACDFTYISGPALTKPQRNCVGVKQITLEALLNNKNI